MLRTILVPTLTSQGSLEMCCHFESPDTYFSFIHSFIRTASAQLLLHGPVHSDVVWGYWTNVAPSPQGRAPVPTPALCTVLAPGDLPFICLDHMMWFCLTGVTKRGLEKSAGPGLCRGVTWGIPVLTPGTRGVTLRSSSALCFGGVSSLKEGRSRSDRDRERNGRAQVSEPCDRDIEERDGHRDEASV